VREVVFKMNMFCAGSVFYEATCGEHWCGVTHPQQRPRPGS
jgi:hypothetical protein